MKIYVCRRAKKDGGGNYLALEARASWGRVILSVSPSTILELIPFGVDHRTLSEQGVCIGEIYDDIKN